MPMGKYRNKNPRRANNMRRKHGGGYSHGMGGGANGSGGMMTRSGDTTGPSGTGGGNIKSGAGMAGYHVHNKGKMGGNRRSYQVSDLYR